MKALALIIQPWVFYVGCLLFLVYAMLQVQQRLTPSSAKYNDDLTAITCPKYELAGRHYRQLAENHSYRIVTPRNYRPDVLHPLLLVYAPAGLSPILSELHSGLTPSATRAGFVIAYVNAITMNKLSIKQLATLPAHIANEWCIDKKRTFATGHSDGGTVTLALSLSESSQSAFSAIAVSAAGWNAADYRTATCPPPTPVLIAHSDKDVLFPGYGEESIRWWANCNHCDLDNINTSSGCQSLEGCTARTVYCKSEIRHWRWAVAAKSVIEFLNSDQLNADLNTEIHPVSDEQSATDQTYYH